MVLTSPCLVSHIHLKAPRWGTASLEGDTRAEIVPREAVIIGEQLCISLLGCLHFNKSNSQRERNELLMGTLEALKGKLGENEELPVPFIETRVSTWKSTLQCSGMPGYPIHLEKPNMWRHDQDIGEYHMPEGLSQNRATHPHSKKHLTLSVLGRNRHLPSPLPSLCDPPW